MAQLFTQIIHSTIQFADTARLEIMILVLTASFQYLLYKFGKHPSFERKRGSPKLAATQSKVEAVSVSASSRKVVKASKTSKTTNIINHNIRIKEQLQRGDFKGAREIIEVMRAAGLKPNIVTFNELLDAAVDADPPQDMWKIVTEMKTCGLQPNHITCSILLKSVHADRRGLDINKVLALMEEMEDEMDEVLLSSLLEACIRTSRSDLLKCQLKKFWEEQRISVQGATAFGSIIRAYGVIHDVEGACRAWRKMRRHKILPTSITLGCVLETLASNQYPDLAHEMIQEVLADAETRHLVNAVNYCSVLKGFSHQKRFDRVWAVYKEMVGHGLESQFTSVTYNTLIDACARCGEVRRAPGILDDMTHRGVEPNLVTYSVVLKGLCHDNQLDKAFELMETMKKSKHSKPDELAYNTLLDGCARQSLYHRGMQVFAMMEAEGTAPSNFTLSILVKLANRGRKLEKSFELCEDLPRKYNFRMNVHVYNNLIQGCILHKDLGRSVEVLASMLQEGIRPDPRTYTLLLQGHINHGEAATAAGLLRAALGLQGATHPRLESFCEAGAARLRDAQLPAELLSEVLQACERRCRQEGLVAELLGQLQKVPGLQMDRRLLQRLMLKSMRK
mmetsp:Transcript_26165/g.53874  ORF Transcript_26165/g.53874 Transcript_26165/m.53874 type:complete len:620 (+) Transcript_26165:139-1998(+)